MIQRVPVESAPFLALPGDFAEDFDQEIDRWRRYLDWVDPDGKLIHLLREASPSSPRIARTTARAGSSGAMRGSAT